MKFRGFPGTLVFLFSANSCKRCVCAAWQVREHQAVLFQPKIGENKSWNTFWINVKGSPPGWLVILSHIKPSLLNTIECVSMCAHSKLRCWSIETQLNIKFDVSQIWSKAWKDKCTHCLCIKSKSYGCLTRKHTLYKTYLKQRKGPHEGQRQAAHHGHRVVDL